MKLQRLDLQYRIVWQGDWHVGSGYQSAAADRLVRLMPPDDTPFVPGSQIKGVLRHQCERLAGALKVKVVDPHAGNQENERRLVDNFVPLAKSNLAIDRLFGNRYQGECLSVTNALQDKGEGPLTIRARTAMDRVTGTVKERHLFTTQLASPGLCLKGAIRARHVAGILTQDPDGADFPFEYALLVTSLLSLEALGGDKSVGLGRCTIKLVPSTLRWNGEDIGLDEALQSFREEGEDWKEMMDLLREVKEPMV